MYAPKHPTPTPDTLAEVSRKKALKTLKRMGYTIDTAGGKGSHVKVVDPKTGEVYVVPKGKDLSPNIVQGLNRFTGKRLFKVPTRRGK